MVGPPAAELRQIDEVRFEELSRSDPVSVEEAAEDALEQLREPAAAPEQASVSLADVRASALENNLDLQVELVNPSIAATLVSEEQARFESTFFATARHTKVDSPTELATESSQATLDEFNLGFRMPPRTGGALTGDMPFGRSDTDNVFSLINPAFDTAARFSISQPLLRGAGIETNEYGIRVAQYERKITDAATRLEAIRILANADRAYWLLYAVRRELEVRLQQYELAVTQLEQARRRVQAGDAPAIEVTRAESGVAERLEAIIRTETLVLQQQRDLKRIMNRPELPLVSATHLLPTTDPDPVQLDLDPRALGESALANRMEMLELELWSATTPCRSSRSTTATASTAWRARSDAPTTRFRSAPSATGRSA
jgi:outer membrane protein TolC